MEEEQNERVVERVLGTKPTQDFLPLFLGEGIRRMSWRTYSLGAAIPLDVYRLAVYRGAVIKRFRDRDTAAIYGGRCPARWRAVRTVAERKLQMLDAAIQLADLRSPPGNRLEKLTGDRAGQWSIRINDQWRICFRWTDAPEDVEITDYH